ncbi:MAG: fumarylacetoacetate hydrolase family protein [Chloroflexota bacterium]
MKLAQFRYLDEDRIGVALGETLIVDLHEAAAGLRLPFNFPYSMRELISFGTIALESVRFVLFQSERYPHRVKPIPLTDIEWLPPMQRPGKVVCVALNNSTMNERKIQAPNHPIYFLKPSSCLVGHLQPIELYDYYGTVHPEPELAVVIGESARHVSIENALDYVYGYTAFNDITGSGMRMQDYVQYRSAYADPESPEQTVDKTVHLTYAARYKGCDTFGPMGPWLVTKNEVDDPDKLDVHCKMNGQIVAEDSTKYMNFSVAEVIAYVSRFHTLEPGDVVCMGSAFRPGETNRRNLTTVDLQTAQGPCEVDIPGIGRLVNPIKLIG